MVRKRDVAAWSFIIAVVIVLIAVFVGLVLFSQYIWSDEGSSVISGNVDGKGKTVISNSSLEGVLEDPNLGDDVKVGYYEQAVRAGTLTEEDLDEAVEAGLLTKSKKYDLLYGDGLWDVIKGKSYYFLDVASDVIYEPFARVIGVKTLSGEGNNVLTLNYWKDSGWKNALFGLWVAILTALFFTFANFNEFSTLPNRSFLDKLEDGLPSIKRRFIFDFIYFVLGFPIIMGIPIFNRILGILTLEFLGIHWVWRGLVVAGVLAFFGVFYKRYYEYRKRTFLYKQELEEATAIEGAKAMLKS